MPFLTKEQILKADDLLRELVHCPEWGGDVWVRTLTGVERDKFEADSINRRGKNIETNMENIRARLVALSVVGEKNERLFTEADAVELGKKSARALDRIFAVAQRLSGLSAEDVEELAKNSDATPSKNCGIG